MSRKPTTRIDECIRESCPYNKGGYWRHEGYVRQRCELAHREFDRDLPIQEWFDIPEWCPLPEWNEQ